MDPNITQLQQQNNENIDIQKFLLKVLANWYWFALTVFIAISIAYFVNRYSDPVYKQSAYVMVQDKENTLSGGIENILEEQGIIRRTRKKVVENEIAVIKSYKLVYETIKQLPEFQINYYSVGRIRTVERYKSCPFTVITDTSKNNLYGVPIYVKLLNNNEYILQIDKDKILNKKMKYGEWYRSENFTFCLLLNEGIDLKTVNENQRQYFFVINDIKEVVKNYRNKISIATTDKKSTVLEISTNGLVPQKEVDFINKLLDVYIQSGLAEKNQIAQNTINFIDQQLLEITDSLQVNENNLKNFRQSNNLIDISKEGSALYERLTDIQKQKSNLLVKKSYLEYLKKYLSSNSDLSQIVIPSSLGIDDPALMELIKQLISLYQEKNTFLITATEKNPAYEAVMNKIAQTKKLLLENNAMLLRSTEISLTEIDNNIAKIEEGFKQLPATEKELINIQRKYKLNDQIYTYLLTKRAEAGIAKASNIPDNKILDYANIDTKVQISPKYSLNYMIAIVLGILFPLIVLVLIDFFNTTITDISEIESKIKIPIIGLIGHNHKNQDFVVFQSPKSTIAESFRTIRTNIQYLHPDKEMSSHVIAITSTVSEEGKTFCALNIASAHALLGKKTVILGLDLRRPRIHETVNVSNVIGVSTYLLGSTSLEEIIIQTTQDHLYFIPTGPIPPNPAELLESKKMQQLIETLRGMFEIIVIDTPPVALVTDALLISRYADTNIFVIRQNYSKKNVVGFLNTISKSYSHTLLTLLINDVKINSYYGRGYNYYSSYGYGYGYGYGYKKTGYYDDEEDFEPKFTLKRLWTILFPFKITTRKK
ncbi:MAG: polysaccharide biosynthesis tyrosine autokinase [Bacteroidales bacterium]|nr:polysaccharide biosynthesis tyrosine autokinase [Bacteroidales bacterium]